jgi:RNA polymerase sigma-70 factor (ECF subfamily)
VKVEDVTDERVHIDNWIKGSREGDEAAARALFNHLHPFVSKLVRAYLPPRESEEDLIQTAFIRIFSNLHRYAGKVPLQHWVSRIAVNTCLKQLRFESHRPEMRWSDLSEAQQHFLDSTVQQDGKIEDGFMALELVEKLLACLNPSERMVMSLSVLEGKSVLEISQITGWSRANIKIRNFRARLKLKKHYAKLMEEKDDERI